MWVKSMMLMLGLSIIWLWGADQLSRLVEANGRQQTLRGSGRSSHGSEANFTSSQEGSSGGSALRRPRRPEKTQNGARRPHAGGWGVSLPRCTLLNPQPHFSHPYFNYPACTKKSLTAILNYAALIFIQILSTMKGIFSCSSADYATLEVN